MFGQRSADPKLFIAGLFRGGLAIKEEEIPLTPGTVLKYAYSNCEDVRSYDIYIRVNHRIHVEVFSQEIFLWLLKLLLFEARQVSAGN